ncbi:MAG: hypothetical protein ACK5DV_03490, partial [Planctomycetota bacterium]
MVAHSVPSSGTLTVRYFATKGSAIGGLVSGQAYTLNYLDAARIQLFPVGTTTAVAISGAPGANDLSELRQDIGIATDTVYYAQVDSNQTIRLATSPANVTAGTFVTVAALESSLGTAHGFFTPSVTTDFTSTIDTLTTGDDSLTFTKGHSFSTGDTVLYTASGATIGGLTDGSNYEVVVIDPTIIQLRAVGGSSIIDLSGSLSGTNQLTYQVPLSKTVYPNAIRFDDSRVIQGDRVLYRKDPSTASSIGLVDGTIYRVVRPSSAHIQLVQKYADASSVSGNNILFANPHGFVNGEKVVYSYVPDGTFGRVLVDAYVIVDSTTQIRLSATSGSSTAITLAASRTDMLPYVRTPLISLVGSGLDGSHSITKMTIANNDPVKYTSVPGCVVNPLVSGTTYFAIVDNATPSTVKLSLTAGGAALDLTQPTPLFIHSLQALGKMTVNAESNISQYAEVIGVQAGLLAVGVNAAKATTSMTITSELGANVKVTAGTLAMSTGGQDRNQGRGISGAGGVISGNALTVDTTTNSTSTVKIGASGGDVTRFLSVTNFVLTIDKTSRFDTEIDSVNASIAGGSGAYSNNNVTSTATIDIGARVNASVITVKASNRVRKDLVGGLNVMSGSGGLIDAPAADSTSNVTANTYIEVRDGASLIQTGSYTNPGDFSLDSYNDVSGDDSLRMDSGGVIPVAQGNSYLRFGGTNQINVGSATLSAVGNIYLTTHV